MQVEPFSKLVKLGEIKLSVNNLFEEPAVAYA